MRCEIVAVGSELLCGEVVDTNAAWIGRRLGDIGVECTRHTKVADEVAVIASALREALARADVVVCSGGLGPTPDDVTREALAEVTETALETRPELVEALRAVFAGRGWDMPESNLRQAQAPAGAAVIEVRDGTAPGLVCKLGAKAVYALPGVPHEMREMFERAVVPQLAGAAGERAIHTRTLHTAGVSEAAVAEAVASRLAAGPAGGPEVAWLAGDGGVAVRLTARAAGAGAAGAVEAVLDAEEAAMRALLGDSVFAVSAGGAPQATIEEAVGGALEAAGLVLAVAESLTGGMLGGRITRVAGSSSWFAGGVIAYAGSVKRSMLGVGDGPVVSAAAAAAMATGARTATGADVGLAVTGVAGPGSQEDQPPGVVWVGLDLAGSVSTKPMRFAGDRSHVREMTVLHALDLLRRALLHPPQAEGRDQSRSTRS